MNKDAVSPEELRRIMDDIANQLCYAVDGEFNFTIKAESSDESIQKLSLLINFVLSSADNALNQLKKQLIKRHQLELEIAHYSRLYNISEMATGIAHEINQPLTSIVLYLAGCLERLKHQNVPPEIVANIQNSIRQAEHAGTIINRIKNFLRKDELHPSEVQLNNIINESIEMMLPMLKTHEIDVELNLSTQLSHVNIDKTQFQQVMVNLISNAIDAMENIDPIRRKLIVTSAQQKKQFVTVCVIDTGPGLHEQGCNQIFEPFYTTKKQGMGMGLAISRSIITEHGGKIYFENQAREGAKICMTLPISVVES